MLLKRTKTGELFQAHSRHSAKIKILISRVSRYRLSHYFKPFGLFYLIHLLGDRVPSLRSLAEIQKSISFMSFTIEYSWFCFFGFWSLFLLLVNKLRESVPAEVFFTMILVGIILPVWCTWMNKETCKVIGKRRKYLPEKRTICEIFCLLETIFRIIGIFNWAFLLLLGLT